MSYKLAAIVLDGYNSVWHSRLACHQLNL
jgi:hypothetical protein